MCVCREGGGIKTSEIDHTGDVEKRLQKQFRMSLIIDGEDVPVKGDEPQNISKTYRGSEPLIKGCDCNQDITDAPIDQPKTRISQFSLDLPLLDMTSTIIRLSSKHFTLIVLYLYLICTLIKIKWRLTASMHKGGNLAMNFLFNKLSSLKQETCRKFISVLYIKVVSEITWLENHGKKVQQKFYNLFNLVRTLF